MVEYKLKTIGELLLDLEFSNDDFNDLIIDTAFADLSKVRSVYTLVGLKPEESNMVLALNQPPEQPISRFEQLVGRLRGRNRNLEYDWTNFIDHLPPNARTGERYLSHEAPESLRDVVRRKLEPLNHQLNRDRQVLESGDYQPPEKNLQKTFNEYVAIPTIALFYFLSTGEIPQIAPTTDGRRSLDNAYLGLQRHLKMMFTDAMVLQYFEDFQDKRSINYILKIDSKLRMAEAFRDVGTKSEARTYMH